MPLQGPNEALFGRKARSDDCFKVWANKQPCVLAIVIASKGLPVSNEHVSHFSNQDPKIFSPGHIPEFVTIGILIG
jgi:hypothetical protein